MEHKDLEEFISNLEESDPLQQARRALAADEAAKALELTEEYLAETPLSVEAINLCAVAAAALGEYTKARHLYQKAAHLDPQNASLHHNYGVLLEQAGDEEQALQEYWQAVTLQPDMAESWLSYAQMLEQKGDNQQAQQAYGEALRRFPEVAENAYERGYICNRMGHYADALEAFDVALQENPQHASSLHGKGYAWAQLGKHDQAIAAYDKALALDPEPANYYFNKALSLLCLNRQTEAAEALQTALDRESGSYDALLEKVSSWIDEQAYTAAERTLSLAEKLHPEDAQPPFYRGLLYERQGQLDRALEAFEESLQRDPDSIYTLNNKGNVLIDLKRFDEALACFDAILRRTQTYPLAYYNRACVFARQGKVKEAVWSLQDAMQLDQRFLEDALQDEDFAAIRQRPSFQRLVQKTQVS